MKRQLVRHGGKWVVAAFLAAPLAIGAQATAGTTIEGRVTEAATGRPVVGANVVLVGTTRGTVVADNGQYRIANLVPGQYQLRALRIGYQASTRSVTVSGATPVTVDFVLTPAAVRLDEVVTTATGEQQRQRETGNAVATIQQTVEQLAVKTNVTDALTSSTPGVTVTPSAGTAGAGARVRIRGANSVSLSNEPLIIVDGVRLNNAIANDATSGSTTLGVGGQVPSRLNDINPEDTESIEIPKGPATAALYGTAAANGVINIRTKKGRPGRAKWDGYSRLGRIRDETSYPANYAQIGRLGNNRRITSCTLDLQTRGLCTPTRDSLVNFNPLRQASPFVDGYLASYGLSARGGSDVASYYVGGDYQREQGVFESNNEKRVSVRANLRSQLQDNLNLQVNSGYTTSRLRLPQNDNNILGIISSGLLGRAFDCSPVTPCGGDTVSRGYLAGQTPQARYAIDTRQYVERFISGANLEWQALSWLKGVGVVGLDYLDRYDFETVPPNRVTFGSLPEGSRSSNPYRIFNYTATGGLTAIRDLSPGLRSSTSAGVQFNKELIAGTRAFGAKLLGGTGSLSGTSARFSVGETNTDNKTLGGYLQQQFAWQDRLFITGALRTDNNSAFGQDFGFIRYPSISGSWVVSEEPFFPKDGPVSSLRLRAAYGQSGQRPNFRDAITYFNQQTVTIDASDVPGVSIGGTGDPGLKPERSAETEVGFEASFFGQRMGIEMTAYDKRTTDLLIARTLAPSLGLTQTQFKNLGSARNRGIEYALNAKLLDRDPVKVDLRFSGSTIENKLLSLGELPPIVFGIQQHRVGYPLGGYWEKPIVGYTPVNGVVSRVNCPGQTRIAGAPPCGIQIGDTAVYLGSSLPMQAFSIEPTVQLFGWLRMYALLDHKGGYKQFNNTARFRCNFGNCREASDPTASTVAQAANIAQLLRSDAGYIENASFTKLRELAFTLSAPTSLARSFRAEGLALTIAGRNLKTWTDYTGFDPEVNSTPGASFSTSDFLTQPPTRIWTTRVSFSF